VQQRGSLIRLEKMKFTLTPCSGSMPASALTGHANVTILTAIGRQMA
jgi:hypothetical protein